MLALFDLDNTLIDRAAAFRRWCEWFLGVRGIDAAGALEWMIETDDDGYLPKATYFALLRERLGLPDSVEDLLDGYQQRVADHVSIEPVVMQALVRLRSAGWRIGIVTNGMVTQERKIEAVGLDQLIDGLAVSDIEGVAKPDRRIFERAAARAGGSLEAAWMVGDHAEYDIVAAAALGCRTVWIHRGRGWPTALPAPDAVCDDAAEAVEVILAG